MRGFINLIVLLFLVMAWSCNSHPTATTAVEGPFVLSDTMARTTTFAKVIREPLQNELELYGKITADKNKLIEVYPVVGGSVTKVFVELGDYVKKGQLLATIRSTEVAGFEKELNDAKNDVAVAKNNLRTAQDLYEGKLNTERDVFTAKSELEKSESQLNRIQATYNIYSLKPNALYEVRSPINGFILQKEINEDMLLRNDHTNNIFDIAQIDEVWAIANVSEADIQQIDLGFDADVTTFSYPGKHFHGKIDKIFNIIDPETRSMQVRIKLDNPDFQLKPEMRAIVRITNTLKEEMLCVPSASIIFDKSKNFVMVYKDKANIETRQVELFRQVGDKAYISSGLKTGEQVITHNQLLIYDAIND
ncbi:MAG: efflux RND transporter periplasmic adaptor subunit [Marinilabiliales bacterium]|nr:efflux RND transporter periplasmic adaptor subunit [Marinilabiliales bacterium]